MKESIRKFALLGIATVVTSMAFMGGPASNHDNSPVVDNQEIVSVADVSTNMTAREKIKSTFNHMNYVLDNKVNNGMEVALSSMIFDEPGESEGNFADFTKLSDLCDVTISFNRETGSTNSLSESVLDDTVRQAVKYDGAESYLLNEFTLTHEVAHCGFPQIDSPFIVKGDSQLTSMLNEIYGDTIMRGSGKAINADGSESKIALHGLADALNESYADAYSSVILLKKYNNSDQIKSFLGKVSSERALNTSISNKVGRDLVDAYDMSGAIKNILNPDVVKKIQNTSDPEALREIALEAANANILDVLAKKTDSELDTALGSWMLKKQGELLLFSEGNTKNEGSILSDSLNKVFSKFSKEEVSNYKSNLEIINWQKDHSEEDILKADKDLTAFVDNVSSKVSSSIHEKKVTGTLELLKAHTQKIKNNGGGKIKSSSQVLDEVAPTLGLSTDNISNLQKVFSQKKDSLPDAPTFSKLKL